MAVVASVCRPAGCAMKGPQNNHRFIFSDYLHFALASLIVCALLAFQGAPPYAFIIVGAIFLAGMASGAGHLTGVSPLLFDWVQSACRYFNPLLLGAFSVLLYAQLHQMETIVEFPFSVTLGGTEYSSIHVPDILKLVQFNEQYQEVFYQAVSSLYAIIVALALVKGIDDVDSMRRLQSEETYSIRKTWNYLKYFELDEIDAKTQDALGRIKKDVLQYAGNSVGKLAFDCREENLKLLDDCREAILDVTPADRDDEIAHGQIVEGLEVLAALRSRRLGATGRKMSFLLLLALWAMSAALIVPFFAEELCKSQSPEAVDAGRAAAAVQVLRGGAANTGESATSQADSDSPGQRTSSNNKLRADCNRPHAVPSPKRWSQYFMIFMMTSFFSFLMLMLHDMSHHDRGFWKVRGREFEVLKRRLTEEFDQEKERSRETLAPVDRAIARQKQAGVRLDQVKREAAGLASRRRPVRRG